jgi:hypothetical protein
MPGPPKQGISDVFFPKCKISKYIKNTAGAILLILGNIPSLWGSVSQFEISASKKCSCEDRSECSVFCDPMAKFSHSPHFN